MRRTFDIIQAMTVAFAAGCGSITVVDNGAEGHDNGAMGAEHSAARGEAVGGQPPVNGTGATSGAADGGQPPASAADGGQPVVAGACSATKRCDDGDVCNLINGTCVQCLLDGDCHSGKHSRCDTARFVCRECLSDDDCDDDKRCKVAGDCK